MPTDDILIRFKADTGQLKAEFDEVKSSLKGVGAEQKKTADQIKTSSKQIVDETKKVSSINESLNQSFKQLGGVILAAFSVQQIIAFGKESVRAFADAEKTAKILQTAVGVNGGLQKDFEALTQQAIELQKHSIFSDEAIKRTQTMALQFGLTTGQVEKLIPVIVDFASATGQSLEGALEAVLRGTEGMARGLKVYGVEVSTTGTKQEKLASITQQLTDKFSGQAEVVGKTTFGAVEKLKNQFNDFQESVGGFVAEAGQATAAIIEWIRNGFTPLDDSLDKTAEKLDAVGKQISEALPTAIIQQQIKQFQALGEAVPQQLIEDLKKINFDKLNKEIAGLNEKELIKKLEDIKNETIGLFHVGDLTIKERLDLINQEIESRKIAGKLIADQNKEDATAAQKALEERQKEDKERRDAQAALAKFTFDEQNKNAELEAAARKENATKTIDDAKDLELALLKIDDDLTNQKIKNAQETNQLGEISGLEAHLKENAAKEIQIAKDTAQDKLDIQEATNEAQIKQADELQDRLDKIAEEGEKRRKENILATIEAIGQVSNEINDLLKANSEEEIKFIEDKRDANSAAIDAQIAKLQEQNDKGRISDEAFERKKKELLDKRAADEKKYNERVKAEKREQAKIDKEIAIFNIILNTAVAIVKALPNVFLAALAGTLGAVELGIAIATPIPAFAKGTKGKQGSGLARVGEQGEEIVFMPSGSKVLPAQKTRQYSEVLDSMFDGKFDEYIHKNYVAPALKLQQPNVNINIDYKKLAKANGQRSSISIDNLHELADMFDHNPRRVI